MIPLAELSGLMIALIAAGAVAGLLLLVLLYGASVYNGLVQGRERTRNGFSQIDVQLTRRYDLIPNLVETCKGYMAHEKGTLEAVMTARASATQARVTVNADPTNAAGMAQLGQAEGALTGALGRLLAVSENYPDLKANGNMAQLMEELTSTENKISFARQSYNDLATVYNTYKKTFPPVLFAGMFNFQDAAYFEVDDPAKKQAVKVQF